MAAANAPTGPSRNDTVSVTVGSSRLLREVVYRAGRWAEAASRRLLREGARPSVEQRDIARLAGVDRVDDVRLCRTPSLPHPRDPLLRKMCRRTGFLGDDTLGVTLGHAICLRPAVGDDIEIFAHESCHIAQVERFGSVSAFTRAYLEEILIFGYASAPLEIEARSAGTSIARQFGEGSFDL